MRWQKRLWDAVGRCDLDAIKALLQSEEVQRELRREQIFKNEEAPLHLAAWCGHNDIIKLLVDEGVDVDSYNVYPSDGYKVTPLHWAAYKNKVGAVKLLLALGADPWLDGKWGRAAGTPREFARQKGHREAARILEECEQWEEAEDSQPTRPPLSPSGNAEVPPNLPEAKETLGSLPEAIESVQIRRQICLAELEKLDSELTRLEKMQPCEKVGVHVQKARRPKREEPGWPSAAGSADLSVTCPVCLSVPRHKIYSCVDCDNVICNACQSKVRACPCCRASFKVEAPRRNRWAERLVLLQAKR